MLDVILYVTAVIMGSLVLIMVYFKDFYQRLICMGLFGNIGALFIVALGSYQYNESFIDIAIIYLLLSYVVNMAVLRALD
jgi:multisubunit Na+/H+ antiporter MnhF subunit